jgi:curved DNA-binding protein CbpA
MEDKTLYEILGVEPNATAEQLKKAYKSMSQKVHPDKNPDDPDAENKFKEVKHAYEVLKDPVKRKNYDETGREDNWVEMRAYQTIGEIYAQMAKQHNYVRKNYLKDVTMAVQNTLRQCTQDKKKFESEIERIEYLIEHTDCPPLMLRGLNHNLAELLHKVGHAKEALEIMKLSLDILDKAKYTGEVPVAPPTVTIRPWQSDPYIS